MNNENFRSLLKKLTLKPPKMLSSLNFSMRIENIFDNRKEIEFETTKNAFFAQFFNENRGHF